MAIVPEAQPRVIDIKEREPRTFPRHELFDSHGRSLVLPETRKLIDLRDVWDGVQLRTLGIVGYLPLTSGIVLNVTPKFPVRNLWTMLMSADTTYDIVLPVLREYEEADASAPHLLLARAFCYYLRKVVSTGLARGYHRKPYSGSFKPKVNFGGTIARYLSRGDDIHVESDFFTFSSDLRANNLLKMACLSFLRIVPRDDKWSCDRTLLLQALDSLHSVTPIRMSPGEESITETLPIWVRPAYFGALSVFSLLLGFDKIGFCYEAQGSMMPSFLLSLDNIFESFVRNTFRKHLNEAAIVVLDGNNPRHQGPLFVDNLRYPVKPDLIFRRREIVVGLGEVKYKPKLEDSDRYQVISHSVALKAPVGVWISPATSDVFGLEFVGSATTGAKFYHYRLDISGDLELASNGMVADVSRLLN